LPACRGNLSRRYGVGDGVHDGGESACRTGLAGPFDAQGIRRAWHGVGGGGEGRQHVGARHRVIHERAGKKLPGCSIEHRFLAKCLTNACAIPPWTCPSTRTASSMTPQSSTAV